MKRFRLAILAGCVALVLSAVPAVALALGGGTSIKLPTVSVPTLSTPSLTVPSVTVPTITVGPVTTPTVSTPTLTTPTLTTPKLTTPTLPTPPVTTPTVSTPSLPTSTTLTRDHGSAPSSTTSPGTASAAGAQPAAGSSGSGTSSTSHRGQGTARRSGHGGGPGSVTAKATAAGKAGTGRVHTSSGPSNAGAATTATGNGGGSTPPGRPASTAAASTKASGPIERLVKVLPTAALIALLAFAVVAAAMALNAYLQSRRARSLAAQRAALLSDVGVLQAALLPAVPASLGELQVSVAYRPAQGLAAGGDFFDVFTLSPERTGIIIGDVSGHGRESLIHAALVRYTLRTLMGEGHPFPEVLARADHYLTGELGDGFATVIICRYEHATGEFIWAKAGHEPPIIAGQPDREEEAATPLGLELGDTWPQFSRFLAPGERVCLFTDGLIESRRHGEQLGRAQLVSLVEQGLSAQELVQRVEADADECTDDLAAVVVTRGVVLGDDAVLIEHPSGAAVV
jgi:serine phosphatase RsbU (regulator of sigma subunit)